MLSAKSLLIAAYLGLAAAQCGPSGAHIQSGTEQCTCSSGVVTCEAFKICGVGNNDADVQVQADCTATVTCTNKGGNTVDVKTKVVPQSSKITHANARNGCVNIPSIQLTEPSNSDFEKAATCPNPNWTKAVKTGSVSCSVKEIVTFSTICGTTPFVTIPGTGC
ncbi:hypothetical protein PMG11_06414 [Penicillium brasilianum]|uniref:Uncharacterized protein n=1 Tax=Penicillium brasilianum TaxID=104259 RepID=A0A0F7TQK2_PENBI|nr:hypothetical protein PMG11_06414 [Penicillium brasilianum]